MRRLVFVTLSGMLLIGNALSAASGPSYAFTAIEIPGTMPGSGSGVLAINGAGQTVGLLNLNDGTPTHGFLLSDGRLTQLDVPGSVTTIAYGINDSGDIVGSYGTSFQRRQIAFLLSGGSFTTMEPPGSTESVAQGINNVGQVVGWFRDGETTHGFLFSQGRFVTIDVPGSTFTQVFGINDAGQMVGTFSTEPNSSGGPGFLLSGGVFTTLDAPGASDFTRAQSINNAGEIVGTFGDANHADHAFVLSAGVFTTIDPPSSVFSEAFGINDRGQIVGIWSDNDVGEGSFLASPAALVSDLLTVDSVETRFFAPSDNPFSQDPAGAFEIVGRLRNGSAHDICNPFIEVVELSGGNRLIGALALSADGEGVQAQNLPSRPPLVFASGATIPFQFIIGLQTRQQFTFLVDISGAPPAAGGRCQ